MIAERESLLLDLASLRRRQETAQEEFHRLCLAVEDRQRRRSRLEAECGRLRSTRERLQREILGLQATAHRLRQEIAAAGPVPPAALSQWLAGLPFGPLAGAYSYTLDSKARVVIPRAFLDVLGQPLRVLAGASGELLLLSPAAWAGIQGWTPLHAWCRTQTATCAVCRVTRRILIPKVLRDRIPLRPQREVTLTGHGPIVRLQGGQP